MSALNSCNENRATTTVQQHLACAQKRQQMLVDLNALDDWQLREIGVWRDAIAATTDDTLSRQGCIADKV